MEFFKVIEYEFLILYNDNFNHEVFTLNKKIKNKRMSMISYKFSNTDNQKFVKLLHSRVNSYFTKNEISRTEHSSVATKILFAFCFYLAIYLTIIFGGVDHIIIGFLLWGLLGVGQAFIGICIHDKLHRSYLDNQLINGLLEIPIIAIGVESAIWKIEHNYLHHNYTNIEGIDGDIDPRFLFRFSKYQPRKWFHQFQHLYAPFFYSLFLVEWITSKDFVKTIKYHKMGLIKTKQEARNLIVIIILKKILFYALFLIIPIAVLPFSTAIIIGMFFTMIAVAGIILTVIFQIGHVVPTTDFIHQDTHTTKENWHIHQLKTTSNFGSNSRLVTYLMGGLNYQIEHHLFPDVCHIHYPEIAKIVRSTATEFSLPYYSYPTFSEAISNHFSLLKRLGRKV
jgi:linoleoyl-CoA desaturase